jgi:AcrR family transcriptional regulator
VSGIPERIMEAMLDLASSLGYSAVSVEDVVDRAGVAREDFDATFSSKEACALAVYAKIQVAFRQHVQEAYESEELWTDSMRAVLYAAAGWVVEHPRETRFAMVETLAISDFAQARRETGFPLFTSMVDGGRALAADPDSVSPLTAEGVVGSIGQLVTKRLKRGEVEPFALVPELMYIIVLPYLGEEAARRELTIPGPTRSDAK